MHLYIAQCYVVVKLFFFIINYMKLNLQQKYDSISQCCAMKNPRITRNYMNDINEQSSPGPFNYMINKKITAMPTPKKLKCLMRSYMHFHQGVPLDISLLDMTCQALSILFIISNHQNQTSAPKKKESLENVDFFLP